MVRSICQAIDDALTAAERTAILARFAERNPVHDSAAVPDVLALMLDRDDHLDVVDAIVLEHADGPHRPALVAAAVLAVLYVNGEVRDDQVLELLGRIA